MNDSFKKSVRKLFARVRLLTILILVAAVAFMVRIGDAVTNVRSISGAAMAAEEVKKDAAAETAAVTTPDTKPDAAKDVAVAKDTASEPPTDNLKSQDDIKKDATAPAADDSKAATGDAAKGEKIDLPSTDPTDKKWQDATDTDIEYPDIKKEMYQDLVKRRQELDDKEKTLAQREALVDASQKEIDHKYKEMVALRDQIQDLLKKQTDEEDTRITSLVKIYSGMKPKDAARIFNTLDMDILLSVISKMPEGKAGLIIANMDPDPARALTTMLAEQKKLPTLPQ